MRNQTQKSEKYLYPRGGAIQEGRIDLINCGLYKVSIITYIVNHCIKVVTLSRSLLVNDLGFDIHGS